jgi:hypothetical protein
VERTDAAKVLCVGQDGGLRHGIAGWLESKLEVMSPDEDFALGVRRIVPTYDPGPPYQLDTYGACLEFEVLSK